MTSATDPPILLTAHHLDEQGLAAWQRGRGSTRSGLERVRRGVYVDSAGWTSLDARERFIATARALALTRPTPLLFSHVTAGILLGLPLVGPLPSRHDFLRVGATGGRSESGLAAHRSPDPDQGVSAAGVRCTSVTRTLVDVAATGSLARSLVMLDDALHRRLATRDELALHVERRRSLRARSRALRVISLADPATDSPGESISRVCFVQNGLQMPETQVEFLLPDGSTARVDFFWRRIGLVGEFDGQVKYGRVDGTVDVDSLWREKRREDALRSLGLRMARWTWADAWHQTPLTRLLTNAGVPRA